MPATARPESTPSGGAPVDVATIRDTVTRALEQGPLPRYEDLEMLEQLLRGHINLLLPDAEKAVDQLDRGSVEWYGQRTMLDVARHRLDEGLGEGMVSARVHVSQLAHSCRALLAYAPKDDR